MGRLGTVATALWIEANIANPAAEMHKNDHGEKTV